jgi:membrane protease YdiL (CAAX protease family)
MDMKDNKWIVLYGLVACGLLYVVEQGMGVSYVIKASLKVLLFLGLPLLGLKMKGGETVKHVLGLEHIRLKDIRRGIKLGLVAFVALIALGVFFAPTIDFTSIRTEIGDKLKVTAKTFLFVGLYITFVNSLLEELFFRGFLYLGLDQGGWPKVAMFFSSILFGIYHMAMFQTWFSKGLVALCVFGLILVGMFFNYVNRRTHTFLNSWVIHIIADSAIMIFAFKMLYM